MSLIITPRLQASDAVRLAPLVAAYSGALLGREAGAPDAPYVATLLAEPMVGIAGAELDGELVGFALYYDLPEAISGRRAGQLDDLYVDPARRGLGIARALVARLVEEGEALGWVHLRWMVPEASPAAALYDRIAERAPWRNYVIRIDRSVCW
ncbi:GNAT family N-acetyltransferase [Hansschlegelia plantiphila]|uniref:N-acetyltransferase n=1 Tax=Hansschlegelia plantiphila TaxID=374655 RepID=A0A9W6MUB4_9HYPH|nr:GNAT family N-acetyltransferase [Hansschlegelia plantiphila]GLK66490.1 N-acetyltransferase [Hansschlegelia plantiphila]